MKTIRHQITIATTPEQLFDLTQDYHRRLEWDPYLIAAQLLNGAENAGMGVEALCKNRVGSAMITRYISFDRPRVAAVTMTKGPLVLKKFSGAWNIRYVSDGVSMLIFTYNFELKGGILGRLLLPFASAYFSAEMKKRLLALKTYIEAKEQNIPDLAIDKTIARPGGNIWQGLDER